MRLKIHVEVFIVSRLLAQRKETFSNGELEREVERLFGDTRKGVRPHVASFCVANSPKGAGTVYNYTWRVRRGHYRLFDPATDRPHRSRADARSFPLWEDVPAEYRYLLP